MFVPVIPFGVKVVNKTIVYSDTILNFKELGKNLNITSISDVGEYSFQNCLDTIFKSNPDVVFNTIQYSKKEKIVNFYTDSILSVDEWHKNSITKDTYSSINVEVLEDLKELFTNPQQYNNDSISIYNVMLLLRGKYHEIERVKKAYEKTMRGKAKESPIRYYTVSLKDFDYISNELSMDIYDSDKYSDKSARMIYRFMKRKGDLYMTKAENGSIYKDDILPLFSKDLSDLYDYFLEAKGFYTQESKEIRPINSGFFVNLNKNGIFLSISENFFEKGFKLYLYNSSNDYHYKCNSGNVLNFLREKENELFHKIFVKIDDCPEWMRPILYLERQKQLQIEQEQFEIQAKKEKRLKLIRKILPFIK